MPSTDQADAAIAWLQTYGLPIAILAVVLLLIYRWTRPAIHRVLVRVMQTQSRALHDQERDHVEIDRRVTTLEDLLTKLLHFAVFIGFVAILLGVFDLWPMLAGLGLLLAAITVAGQSIVLDILMGMLILVEAQYFKGDIVRIGTTEGTVEDIGLRRTVIRDNRGTLHSISNGLIRESANLTRTYAAATIHIDGIAGGDVERAIEVLDTVGRELADDPTFGPDFIVPAAYAGTTGLTSGGATLRLRGRVRPEARNAIEAEMRRRVAAGLAAADIEPIRPVGGIAGPTPPPR